jgi:pilus assembly protein CpaB
MIAQTAIKQGETLTGADVGPRSARQGLTFVIPDGMRAVTVALDAISGVGGFVYPGDRVDVLVTFQQGEVAVTKMILQNVEVLAMNELTRRPASQQQGATQVSDQGTTTAEGEGEPETIQVKSATLSVSPDEAQSLLLSAFKGAVHLALRPRESDEVVSLAGQTDWSLMDMEPPSEEPAEPTAQAQQPPNGWPPMYGQMQQTGQPPQMQGAQPGQQQAGGAQQAPTAPSVEVFRGGQREVVTLD